MNEAGLEAVAVDCRRMTPEEIRQADAAYRQWWLSVLTLGLIPKPEPELEIG